MTTCAVIIAFSARLEGFFHMSHCSGVHLSRKFYLDHLCDSKVMYDSEMYK